MMKIFTSKYTILILLIFIFQNENIAAVTCDNYNITYSQQNDAVTINFSSNDLLKLNRTVQCTPTSTEETVYGCAHQCVGLGYGQEGEILIEMQHDNGTIQSCTMAYTIELCEPTLAFFNVPGNRVRLGINRPMGSFDYVNVQCSNNESYLIFNTSTPLNSSIITVDCSFIPNLPLMSFILETIKKDFRTAVNHISQEVPLPVPFDFSLDSRLLTIQAYAPPLMNLNSTYEFQLVFFDKNDENIIYKRATIANLLPNLGISFNYSLIPNLKHKIIFTHIVNATMYAESSSIVLPISNMSYPFAVINLHIEENYHNIIVSWSDSHSSYDQIEYIVSCNSNNNYTRNVGRNTTYVCENMTFSETNSISVETRLAIPGYIHNRMVIAILDVPQVPQIPIFEVFNRTETSITVRWQYSNDSFLTNTFEFNIKCGLNANPIQIDIRSNEYVCQSLEEGTTYVITMLVGSFFNIIQRSSSIQTNTLLPRCQYQSHFYSSDFNGTRFVIIEWSPPDKNFDKIYVQCPSTYIPFEYNQVTSFMYVKCIIFNGVPFNVTFATVKSGFEWAIFQFTDTPPSDSSSSTASTSLSAETSSITDSNCSQDIFLKTEINMIKWRTAAIIAFIVAGVLALSTICLIVFSVLLYLRNRYNVRDE
ncbi:unnamed protein product [Adineta steineri]|uniref:Fibronectin type-III domain-containing protein n=1 Tax=Adineta steineri TaxID=433720 RepID=A0A818I492_9BILA|nr:unnamed protein product [Adineta steineri]CAF3518790.1 unnamed protein product [Adineta steineri]